MANPLTTNDLYAMKNLLLYEDNAELSESIQSMLDLNKQVKLVGAFKSPVDVKNHLSDLKPDLMIMDIDMPGMNGIEAVRQVRTSHPDIPILMLTVFDDNKNVFDAICAGASGYLLKKHISSRLFAALEDVLEGGSPMSPTIARMVLSSMQKTAAENPYQLTPKEKEVLASLSKGNSYKLVADDIKISIDTVRSHIRNIYDKLHVHSQAEAVAKALKEKLV